MTYNFDPEYWYDMEYRALMRRRRAGELDDADFDSALAALQDRYEEMMDGLNTVGGFQMPPVDEKGPGAP